MAPAFFLFHDLFLALSPPDCIWRQTRSAVTIWNSVTPKKNQFWLFCNLTIFIYIQVRCEQKKVKISHRWRNTANWKKVKTRISISSPAVTNWNSVSLVVTNWNSVSPPFADRPSGETLSLHRRNSTWRSRCGNPPSPGTLSQSNALGHSCPVDWQVDLRVGQRLLVDELSHASLRFHSVEWRVLIVWSLFC